MDQQPQTEDGIVPKTICGGSGSLAQRAELRARLVWRSGAHERGVAYSSVSFGLVVGRSRGMKARPRLPEFEEGGQWSTHP